MKRYLDIELTKFYKYILNLRNPIPKYRIENNNGMKYISIECDALRIWS